MITNSLIDESSPYLLQHAHNPVEWYAWNDLALKKAQVENKPIFLSVGYSACHWCHVMAHESFENKETAAIMNENFVNIKVDREERPDLDDVYQKVCQAATGQGGWPLSVFLTPDQKPFFVGTYFPALEHYGRPSFQSVLHRLSQAWKENKADISLSAQSLLHSLQGPRQETVESEALDKNVLNEAAVGLYQMGDAVYGGFGQAPKFPSSLCLSFLFRYSKISNMSRFSRFALMTLDKMARGGIFDQVGGGFHRYSTDARWLVPHFEKMLYDNALIPVNYAEAYQITRDPFYLDIMRSTLDFVLREMTSPEGGFYSAIDADSEGEEGRFYTWTKTEICDTLGEDADVFCLHYDVTDGGNWEGNTILCNSISIQKTARHTGRTEEELRRTLKKSAKRLLDVRSKRVRPGTDDKIITSWNGLMITALVKGHRLDGQRGYLEAAERCAGLILDMMYRDGILLRTYKNGHAKIHGYLEDYAFFADALLDLFEVTADPKYLESARILADFVVEHFWSKDENDFFMTSDKHEELVIRPKSIHDLSLPSGNSVATGMLHRLYHLTQEDRYLAVSGLVMRTYATQAAENPFAFGHMLNVIYRYLLGPTEMTILGGDDNELTKFVNERFLPEAIITTISDRRQLSELDRYPFFAGKGFSTDKARAYVCKDMSCTPPLESVDELKKHI